MSESSTTPRFRASRKASATALAVAGLVLVGCIPIFSGGAFQTLQLIFELSETIASGEQKTLHLAAFPEGLKIKKTFVQVSGALAAPPGENLPEKLKLLAVHENAAGKTVQRISLTLSVEDNGSFKAKKKIKKNIGAGDILTVTLEPSAGDLRGGTSISVCVDLVKKKSALNDLPACVEQNDDGAGGQTNTLSSLQADFLTPTCARAGCHDSASSSAGLVLADGQSHGNLVNVASSQVPSLNRVTPNDPENSYLIKKLRGDADISGQRMPAGGPFLSEQEIARFIAWVNEGALDR